MIVARITYILRNCLKLWKNSWIARFVITDRLGFFIPVFERRKMNFKVIAVDFDGTLCEDKWPEIGKPNIDDRSRTEFVLPG